METLIGKYLVSKWGYSMILATYVRVIKETPKTLLVEEVDSRTLNTDELAEKHLTPGYLQCYSVPTENSTHRNGTLQSPFRIYKRGNYHRGKAPGMSTYLNFEVWTGNPEFEDHCD
jgi:hypothetical protein